MLLKRMLVNIVLVPGMMLLVYLGGLTFSLFIAFVMAVAAWEYHRIYKTGGYAPSLWMLIFGAALLALRFVLKPYLSGELLVTVIIIAAMTVHVFAYERGMKTAATDFSITLAGIFYLGWLGGYLDGMQTIADGRWWLLFVMLAVWVTDAGAYAVGKKWGKHPMSPLVSPKKTWEGYIGGVVFSLLVSWLLGFVFHLAIPAMTIQRTLLLGTLIALLTPMGDLGESMIKRQFNFKDSSKLLPGIGGVMDRIDSWLWAGAIGYFLVTLLWV